MHSLITRSVIFGLLSVCVIAVEPDSQIRSETGTRPYKIIEGRRAVYPYTMMNRGIKHGTVSLILEISETGRLADILVTAYSHKPFADEALRAVKQWKFEPGLVNGRPITTLLNITFKFEVNGVVVIDRKENFELPTESAGDGSLAYQARGMQSLDRIPAPIKVISPDYPKEYIDRGLAGPVTVDFYIDETGKTRMASCPVINSPELASLALTAVSQWQFAPPTAKGKPVLVQAQQVFHFGE